MRVHGVTKFPDPSATGLSLDAGQVDTASPQFKAAQQACRALLPNFREAFGSRPAPEMGGKTPDHSRARRRNQGAAARVSLGLKGEAFSRPMLQLIDRIAAPHLALRGPRRSIRLRLTIVYASLLLASGAALLAVTYVLVARATGDVPVATRGDSSFALGSDKTPSGRARPAEGTKLESVGPGGNASSQRLTPQQAEAQLRRDAALAKRRHDADLHQLLEHSGIALAIMAALSIPLGWLATARVLRPIRTITERAHAISATNLHRRLALALHGPDDELKHLATTFDELLDRLEASLTAQRQFAANASHELRAPLTRTRTLAEIALGDPDATVDSLRASHERVLAAGKQQERLIEALLTLARSERGLDERNPFDLAAVTATTLHARHEEA
jgi:signal transduction histidine kinase